MSNDSVLPVLADVDILVIGATAAAVAAALAAKENGVSVYVLSSRPFFGEDICSLYRFWPQAERTQPLSQLLFPQGEAPPTPMHVKLTLEQALVSAGIPFLFNCFPAGVLRSEIGNVSGVAVANRTGIQAIRSRVAIDASLDGMLLKQAGSKALKVIQGECAISYTTLCEGEGQDPSGVDSITLLPGYTEDDYTISARKLHLTANFGDGSPTALSRAYSEVVDRCWVPQEYRHQTRIMPQVTTSRSAPSLVDLEIEPGLLGLSEMMALPAGAESYFTDPCQAISLAESAGREISNALPSKQEGALRMSCEGSQNISSGQLRTLSKSIRFGDRNSVQVEFDALPVPHLGAFDVLVVGGGTAGAPAAISAARAGAETLLIELSSGLGGVGTMGQIARYWHGNRVGFTSEIDRGVKALEYKEYFKERAGDWSIAAKSAWYHQPGRTAGCTYWFNTLCAGATVKNERVTGILVAGPYGYGLVETGCVVDCTGCADIPAIAGAPTTTIGKEHIAVQGTGLAGCRPGRDYHNSDHSFSDDTDIIDTTTMLTAAKLKFKGDFDCGELIDSRERRQIIGDYSITPQDIIFKRRFPDTVCVASSNFDSHGFTVDPLFMLHPAEKKEKLWADIPLRCFLPKQLDGVLVTGLGLSAHRDALPVIRMQADVQNQGYAAGLIAALSAQDKTPIRELDIHEIQRKLIEVGNLSKRVLDDEDNFPIADSIIEQAALERWDQLDGVAALLHDARGATVLERAYAQVAGEQSSRSIRYAQILAFHRNPTGKDELARALESAEWDKGWHFRGMGQFGMTLSEVDKNLICLGMVGGPEDWGIVLQMTQTLPEDAEFSHFRALAMCCETLFPRHANLEAAEAFSTILERENYTGHAQTDIREAQAALTDNINENIVREFALRELHLARALIACGDCSNRGRQILEAYSKDSRGHFARHAKAVLGAFHWQS